MSYGRNNFFDDNRRGNFRSNFDDDPFSRGFSNNDNSFDLRRQRSPIFNERNHFNSVSYFIIVELDFNRQFRII